MKYNEYLKLSIIKDLNKGNVAINSASLRETRIKEYVRYCQDQMQCKIFYIKNKDEYIFCFKIPSSSNYKYTKPFFYDVILSFTPPTKEHSLVLSQERTINDYKMQIYSNMLSFIFTYQYVFKENKYLIPWIPYRFWNSYALNKPAETRNPFAIINYEKSLYFSYIYIISNKLYDKEFIKQHLLPTPSYSSPLKEIRSQNDIKIELDNHKKRYTEKRKQVLDSKKRRIDNIFSIDPKKNNIVKNLIQTI